jgi:GTP cyclohydrolase I
VSTSCDLDEAASHYAAMLAVLGVTGDARTPMRYVRALVEMTRGGDPAEHLAVQFDPVGDDPQLITVTDIPFVSLCEHHMLPFWGHATVGYLPKPGGRVVGLSKVARALHELARRPQLQEALGTQLVDALMSGLNAAGAAVSIRSTHTCMALRGAATGPAAAMVTTLHRGELLRDPYRAEFNAVAGL